MINKAKAKPEKGTLFSVGTNLDLNKKYIFENTKD
jgi:hypothetical protein